MEISKQKHNLLESNSSAAGKVDEPIGSQYSLIAVTYQIGHHQGKSVETFWRPKKALLSPNITDRDIELQNILASY